jgi:hypothetical protein
MSKDARDEDLDLTPETKAKFDELVAMLARRGFGERPPRDTTFAQIEEFGHQAGRMVARAVDAHLADQHAEHFVVEEPCPSCGEQRRPKEKPHDLPLQTTDGEVTLHEPAGHCPRCRRDFFPSANLASP